MVALFSATDKVMSPTSRSGDATKQLCGLNKNLVTRIVNANALLHRVLARPSGGCLARGAVHNGNTEEVKQGVDGIWNT